MNSQLLILLLESNYLKKAFTLIELLIVVAIIGILAGVGIPMYNGYMADAKKRVTEANHKVIYQFMLSETTKCEIDSSGGIMMLDGENLLKCSDLFGSDVSTSKINHAMKNFFNAHIKHAYRDEVLIFPGHYTASCLPSGNSPDDGGFGEQGTHHLAVGWWPNEKKLTLYLDTCIESSGKALSKVYHIRGKE